MNPATRLERGDFGVIVEPAEGLTPPSLSDYTLVYADEAPEIPAVIQVPEVFIHPLDGEPERISAENLLRREDAYWSPGW